MDPEQRLFIIQKYLAVKFNIFVLRTVAWILAPQRMDIAEGNRALHNLHFLLRFALFAFLRLFCDMLYHFVCLQHVRLVDSLILRLRIRLGQEDLHRHEGTVLFQHFSCAVFIGKFQAVIIQEQGDLRPHLLLAAVLHLILCAAVADPVYRYGILTVGQGINVYLIGNHERGIESQSEVSDHLIFRRLILILLQELGRSGERDLRNILFYFICSHSKAVINELQCLLFRVDDHLDLRLVILRHLIFAHHIQLFQFRDGVTSIGDQLSHKNIMVRIHPLLDYWKYILTVNG